MASSINASTAGSGGVITTADNSGVLNLQTAGTTAVTVDASQNVGIGTASPAARLDVRTTSSTQATFTRTGQTAVCTLYQSSADTYLSATNSGANLILATQDTERMRIDSSGNAMVGTTGTTGRFEIYKSDSVGQCSLFINNPDAQGTGTRISFRQTSEQAYFSSLYSGGWNLYARSGQSGGVVLAQNATSWTSSSDERLKNITGTYSNALTDIAQIQAIKFTWKSDEANTPQVGVTAQSVQNVVPEAVTKCKMSEDDPTEYLGVRYTELIPLLIASVQELNAKVNAQAAEIATLKGAA